MNIFGVNSVVSISVPQRMKKGMRTKNTTVRNKQSAAVKQLNKLIKVRYQVMCGEGRGW